MIKYEQKKSDGSAWFLGKKILVVISDGNDEPRARYPKPRTVMENTRFPAIPTGKATRCCYPNVPFNESAPRIVGLCNPEY